MSTTRSAILLIAIAAGLSACQGDEEYINDGEGGFDQDDVILAGDEVCEVKASAQDCVDLFPVELSPDNADWVEGRCVDEGYTCCSPEDWISEEAALCIAETDSRVAEALESNVILNCDVGFGGPVFGIWQGEGQQMVGLGIHASSGAITWYNDGSGLT